MTLTPDQTILVERAALQLSGMRAPLPYVHAVMRGLGLAPAEAAPLFPAIEARIGQIEAGDYDQRGAVEPECDTFPEHPMPPSLEDRQLSMMRLFLELSLP